MQAARAEELGVLATPTSATPDPKGTEAAEDYALGAMLLQSSSDLYFTAFSSAAAARRRKRGLVSSDSLISKLLPDLTPEALAAARNRTGAWSPAQMEALALRLHRHKHSEWSSKLESGFSLLFHGIGSLEGLLTDYVETRADAGQGSYVIVRGYVPGMRAEKLLQACETATANSEASQFEGELESFAPPSSTHRKEEDDSGEDEDESDEFRRQEAGDDAEAKYASPLEARAHRLRLKYHALTSLPPLHVLAIGLDHRSMLSARAQTVLSILARAPRIFLIGTASHTNAGLLLGPSGSSLHVPWLWNDLETYVPPLDEMLVNADYRKTIELPRALQLHLHSGRSTGTDSRGAQANVAGADSHELLSTAFQPNQAQSIIAQVTPKAKKLFILIARLQLGEDPLAPATDAAASTTGKALEPVQLQNVYEHATKQFLANNLDTVKNLLVEGFSHGLVRLVKWTEGNPDLSKLQQGHEYLWINMSAETLRDVVKQISARL